MIQAMTLKTTACGFCGDEFAYDTLDMPYQRYCSPTCRKREGQRKRDVRISGKPRRCPRCGETKEASEYASYSAPYCRPCMAAYAREKRPLRTPEQRLNNSIRERAYRNGLTVDALKELFASQNGECAICGADFGGLAGAWHIDHDHACCPDTHGRKNASRKRGCGQCIRGLLCGECNVGLGMLREDPEILRAAIAYLKRYTRMNSITDT